MPGCRRIQSTKAGSVGRWLSLTEIAASARPKPNHQPRPSGEKNSQVWTSLSGTELWITIEMALITATAASSSRSQPPRHRSPSHAMASTKSGSVR